MNRRTIVHLLIMAILVLSAIMNCEKKPTAPQRDNPFDPKNTNYDNIPPKIVLNINTLNGITNETEFVFDASKSYENDEQAFKLLAKWDLDGDGSYDEELKKNNLIKHIIYDIGGGKKVIKLQLSGAKALTVDTSFTIFVNTRPEAAFTFTQTTNYPLPIMKFDASASKDYEDGHNLQYRWDFENDGVFDTNWLIQDTISHQYYNVGTYQISLSVKDQNGLTSKIEQYVEVKPFVEMVFVQGDTFQMGDTWDDGESDEKPVHKVTVNSFYIGKYEVTQAQYQEIMGNNPSDFRGDNLPVEQVRWYDAVSFCNRLSKREGLEPCYTINDTDVTCDFTKNGYRLPTEAEWEYAARGGNQSQGYKYSGSNNPDAVAWYYDNSENQTHDVGSKQPNELGIYDMSGNVWEWCWDWYALDYYENSPYDNPKGPNIGLPRVRRGGCWANIARHVRMANRSYVIPSSSSNYLGFRLLRTTVTF